MTLSNMEKHANKLIINPLFFHHTLIREKGSGKAQFLSSGYYRLFHYFSTGV